jgi:predicted HAD superfamily Cof-like phosphohydrolase
MFPTTKDFTSCVNKCDEIASPLDHEQLSFLLNMCASELVELAQTRFLNPIDIIKESLTVDFNPVILPKDETQVLADQMDAMVDILYYMLDACAKKGIDLEPVFNEVHKANMNKIIDGKIIRRNDGKILKPENWKAPDIRSIAEYQSRGLNII